MAQNSGGWKPYDGYNGRSMNDILNEIKAKEAAEEAAETEPSINILNLGRELEAMEQRRQLQEQKDRAMEDMRRQADRGRSRAKKSWENDMRDKAIQSQRELQAREREQREMGKIFAAADKADKRDAPKPTKKKIAPPAPSGKFNRKIDWKE